MGEKLGFPEGFNDGFADGLPAATEGDGVALTEGFAVGLNVGLIFTEGLKVGAADITTAIATTISTARKLILRSILVFLF